MFLSRRVLLGSLGALAVGGTFSALSGKFVKKSVAKSMTKKEIISSKNAPKAIGPYSQANKVGNTIYFSGQLGMDPATSKIVEGGIEAQTTQCLKNIKALLTEVGATEENVVKTTIFITSMANFKVVNGIYAKMFTKNFPARSTVGVKELPLAGLIEIEVVVIL